MRSAIRCQYPIWTVAIQHPQKLVASAPVYASEPPTHNATSVASLATDPVTTTVVQGQSSHSVSSQTDSEDYESALKLVHAPRRNRMTVISDAVQQNFEFFVRVTFPKITAAGPARAYRKKVNDLFVSMSLDESSLRSAYAGIGSVSAATHMSGRS